MQLLIKFSVWSHVQVGLRRGAAEFCLDQTERITWLTGAIFSTAQVPYNEWMFDLSIILIINIPMRVFCNSHEWRSEFCHVMYIICSVCVLQTGNYSAREFLSNCSRTDGKDRGWQTRGPRKSKACVFTSEHSDTVAAIHRAPCSTASIVSCCQQLSGVIDDTLGEWLAQWFNYWITGA